ncbi:MAG: hypothetical protein RBG13Loki_4351 [Promethearchaeota archaeon CR_4]|nr:MAG: hypothetical protein RBG13Loki_4351 [Candidatus Lokiarchaeota archaeon CR_4]
MWKIPSKRGYQILESIIGAHVSSGEECFEGMNHTHQMPVHNDFLKEKIAHTPIPVAVRAGNIPPHDWGIG